MRTLRKTTLLFVLINVFISGIVAAADNGSNTMTLPDATIGLGYTAQLSLQGYQVTLPYSVAITGLPAGLSSNDALVISGTPLNTDTAKDYPITVTITDGKSVKTTATANLHLNAAPQNVAFSQKGAALPPATVNQRYETHLDLSSLPFPGPYTISLTNQPDGLTVDSTGKISGTPTTNNHAEGEYRFTVSITSGTNHVDTPARMKLFLDPQSVTVGSLQTTCNPGSSPVLTTKPREGATVLTGTANVPKDCTAKIRVWVPTEGNKDLADSTRLANASTPQLLIKSGQQVATDGTFTLQLDEPLNGGELIKLEQDTADSSGNPATQTVAQAATPVISIGDWGRVRAYFTGGILLSQNQGSFSQAQTFLSFLIDKSWRLPGYYHGQNRLHPGFNTFFETRLTAVPVTAEPCPAGQTTGQCAGNTNTNPNAQFNTFITSQKTAKLLVGGYFPFTMTTWTYKGTANSLFVAPLAKVGFDTPTGPLDQSSAQSQSMAAGNASGAVIPVNTSNFYNFYGYGVRTGHYAMTKTTDSAPELISWLDVIVGRFSNLETVLGSNNERKRLYRFSLEGFLKVPSTPLLVGFSANVGQSQLGAAGATITSRPGDDLRFLFGTKFDVGKILTQAKQAFQ